MCRTSSENLAAAFDFELAFEDVERLILAVMDVLRCPMMRRHDPLSERIATLGVFADCL